MRFLVDAQLPPALARWLGEKGFAAKAVRERSPDYNDIVDTIGILGILGTLEAVKFDNQVAAKLRITHIVKATGLSKSTLIRYEAEGKLPVAKRDGRKWRFYTVDDRNRIVSRLKNLQLM